RATRGNSAMVMAVTTLLTLARVSAIRATASRIGGIDIMPSMMRMMLPSAQRTNPEISPTARPASEARIATDEPTGSDTPAHDTRVHVAPQHGRAEPKLRGGIARALCR